MNENKIVSPIRDLDNNLKFAIEGIAPEKSQELSEFCIEYDPSLVFTSDQKFSFRVDTKSKEIKLPTGALEYLWCACYAFNIIYQEYGVAIEETDENFDLNGNYRLRNAISLYEWGMDQLNKKTPMPWPSDKDKPDLSCSISEDTKVANELYLCSVSWIIHHELAHIKLGHSNLATDGEKRKQEQEADNKATEWILKDVSDELILNKRGLGVAIAALVMTSQDILAGVFKHTTHPRSFERLYNAICPYFSDPDHLVYAFSVVVCHTNMAISGMKISADNNQTWQENLETCLVEFSKYTE